MNKFLSVLIASAFAASVSLHAYAAEPASTPAAAATAEQAKTKKPRRHWCKATQQFQTAPCPKKARKHWCRTTQQFQTAPCPHVRKKWCITTQQFQTTPCPKKGAAKKDAASAPAAIDKK